MPKLSVAPGTTGLRIPIFIPDSSVSTGAGKTTLAYDTANLKAYYVRPGSVASAIPLVTQTVTGAYTPGGFVEVDATKTPGLYLLDVPNSAIAYGVPSVAIQLSGASNAAPVPIEIELDATRAAARIGVAAAGAAGSITLDASASASDNYYRFQVVDVIAGTGAGQSRFIPAYNGTSKVATVVPNWIVNPDSTSVFRIRYFGLDAAAMDTFIDAFWDELGSGHLLPGSFGARLYTSHNGTAAEGGTASITLANTASGSDNAYKDQRLIALAGAGAGQSAKIKVYTGSTKVAQFYSPVLVAFDNTTVYMLVPDERAVLEAESIDRVLDAPLTKPTAVPSSWTLRNIMAWMGAWTIFKRVQPSPGNPQAIRNDDDSGNLGTATTNDDGANYTRGKWS